MKKTLLALIITLFTISGVSASYENAIHLCEDDEFLAGNETTTCKSANDIFDLVASCSNTGDILKWNGLTWTCQDDNDTNAATLCDTDQFLDGDGDCIAISTLSDDNQNLTATTVSSGARLDITDGTNVTFLEGGATTVTRTNESTITISSTDNYEANTTIDTEKTLCATGNVLKWNGSVWGCETDNDTPDGFDPDTDISDVTTTLAGNTLTTSVTEDSSTHTDTVNFLWNNIGNATNVYMGYMPNNIECSDQQTLKWDATDDQWLCADDTDTTGTDTNAATLCGSDKLLDGDGNCIDIASISGSDDQNIAVTTRTGGGISFFIEGSADGNPVDFLGAGATTVTNSGNKTITISSTDQYEANTDEQHLFETVNVGGSALVADSPNDTLSILPGNGITLNTDTGNDTLTITAVDDSTTNEMQNLFSTIAVPTGTDALADEFSDTLTLTAGAGITITGSTPDSIEIASTITQVTDSDIASMGYIKSEDDITDVSVSLSGTTLTVEVTEGSTVQSDTQDLSTLSSSGGGITLSCDCDDSNDYGNMCYGTYNSKTGFWGCKGYDDPNDVPDAGEQPTRFKLDTFGI